MFVCACGCERTRVASLAIFAIAPRVNVTLGGERHRVVRPSRDAVEFVAAEGPDLDREGTELAEHVVREQDQRPGWLKVTVRVNEGI